MKKAYLLIKCGYEGIEDLIYLTTDRDIIVEKITKIRDKINKNKENFEKIINELGLDKEDDEAIQKAMLNNDVKYKKYRSYMYENPDQYCIRYWNGKNFSCHCKELDVKPTETWLY